MRRALLYAGVFYLALCATCYACRAEQPTDEQIDASFYDGLSCERLNDVSLRMAMSNVHARREGRTVDRSELVRVLQAMQRKGCEVVDPIGGSRGKIERK